MITENIIVKSIYKKANTKVPMKDIDVIVRDCFKVIRENLENGKQVYISDLGTIAPQKMVKKSFVKVSAKGK